MSSWKKRINNFYFSWKVAQSRYKYYFYVEFLDGGKWKNIFQSYFLETWRSYNEFYGAIDISYQIRGAEFPVIRGMEKPKLLHSELVRQQAGDMWP